MMIIQNNISVYIYINHTCIWHVARVLALRVVGHEFESLVTITLKVVYIAFLQSNR